MVRRFEFVALASLATRCTVAGSAAAMIAGSWVLRTSHLWGAEATLKPAEALVVTPDDTRDPNAGTALSGGTSSTAFSFDLPAGAGCESDSADGDYRVQSYMVSASVDPGTLQFGSNGPTPASTGVDFRQPLFDAATTASYVNAMTAKADTPGGPGLILTIPAFNFAVYSPGNVPPGTYNIGLACTLGPASPTQMKRYWNAQVSVAAAANDPAGITWTTVRSSAESPSESTPKSPQAPRGRVPLSGVASTSTSVAPTTVPAESEPRQETSSDATGPGDRESSVLSAAKETPSSAGRDESEGGEGRKRGGEPTFVPFLDLLVQASRTEVPSWPLLGWALLLVLLGRLAVLSRRSTSNHSEVQP